MSAIVFGGACVLLLLLSPWTVPQVSAGTLLADAMKTEGGLPAAVSFQVQISGEPCARGTQVAGLLKTAGSDRCSRALRHLQATSWGQSNPLSARTYSEWRASLHRHKDQVTRRDASWEIRTTTDEGVVHEALLDVRASDYHPTRLTLSFDDDEELSIIENTEPVAAPLPPPGGTTETAPPPVPRPAENPADVLEVEAWRVLHELSADSGWEATVVRDGSQVEVVAVTDSEERHRGILEAFAAYPGIVVNAHASSASDSRDGVWQDGIWPSRIRSDGDGPGLAETMLEQQFPDTEARESYSNRTFHISRQLIGRAFFLDRLQQRRRALAHCSCAGDLSGLLKAEEQSTVLLQAELSSMIEPFVGSRGQGLQSALTPEQAQRLDVLLQELLLRSKGPEQDAREMDARIQEIHDLLYPLPPKS